MRGTGQSWRCRVIISIIAHFPLLHSYSMPRKKWWSRKSKFSLPGYKKSPNRQRKHKQWNEAQILSAIETAMSGGSANQAARQHGVPPSTLKDRLNGWVLHGAKPGPRPYLRHNEEKELNENLITSAKVGFGKTRRQIKGIAESVAKEKGILKGEQISNRWWQRFLERNPTISLRSGDSTAQVRMQAINRENVEQLRSSQGCFG